MKLYLSSYHLGNKAEEFAKMFGANKKVAVIANAMDIVDPEMRREKTQGNLEEMAKLGLLPSELDLRDYFGRSEKLGNKLDEYGGVWVRGGNTFVLRRAMKYSGMDEYLREKIKSEFVYGGYSAGICVLVPDMRGLDIVDDPKNVPIGYEPETIWEGVGLVDKMIVPHYKSDHPESYMVDKSVEWLESNKIPYETLRDGEVIIKTVQEIQKLVS